MLQLGNNGIAQGRIAGDGRVAGIVLVDGFLGGFLDVIGGVEVGFTHAEVDDIDALRFQFIALLRHGQCFRRGKAVQTI